MTQKTLLPESMIRRPIRVEVPMPRKPLPTPPDAKLIAEQLASPAK
jgi:hypothetical protein